MEEKYKGYYKDSLSWLYASDIEDLYGTFDPMPCETKDGRSPVGIFIDELSKAMVSPGGWDGFDAAVDRACDKAEAARESEDLGGEMKQLYEKIVKTWIEIYGEEQVDTWLSEIDRSDEDK